MCPFSRAAMLAAAAMMESAGVKAGLVSYLCLEKTLLEILVVCDFSMLIRQQR